MPTSAGPNTFGQENLVFGYDLGDVSNSYKGRPTTHVGTDLVTHTSNFTDLPPVPSTIAPVVYTSGKVNNSTTDWQKVFMSTNTFSVPVGQRIVVSCWVYVPDSKPANRFNMNCTWNGGNTGFTSFQNIETGKWVKLVGTYLNSGGAPATVSQVRLEHYQAVNWTGNTALCWGINWMIEVLSDSSTYQGSQPLSINSTRSATQGLLDLTGNSTIDLTNVSFDSNAQMTFDDTDDYIQLASDGTGTVFETQTFTIETVIYPTVDPDTSEGVIWSYDYTSHVNPYYSQHLRLGGSSGVSNEIGFYWNNGSTVRGFEVTEAIPTLNVHYHIVATFTSGYQAVYINGVLANSSTYADTITYYNQEVWISRSNFGGYFGGNIPLLKFYNRALTASEVQSNYRAVKNRFNI